MTKRKSPFAARLGLMALALTLMTTCLMGSTLAKYTTTVSGTGTGTVAAWSFKANGSDSTISTAVDLGPTVYGNVTNGKIAPGTQGQFKVDLDATGSEVGIDYTVNITDLDNAPANLKFYSDAARQTEITDIENYTFSGEIALNASSKTVEVPVYWKWAYETGENAGDIATNDRTDTGAGTAVNKAITFNITIVATQQRPA